MPELFSQSQDVTVADLLLRMALAMLFGGVIGLNSPLLRALSLEGLEFLGVRLDGFKNRMAIAGMDISMEDAPVRVFTVHTDEEIIVARKAAALLSER